MLTRAYSFRVVLSRQNLVQFRIGGILIDSEQGCIRLRAGVCIKGEGRPSLYMRKDKFNLRKEFAKTYDDLSDALFRHCFFRLSDRERALDLMQETFIRVWNVLANEREEIKNLKAYLYKTANNLIIDEYRARRETVSVEAMRESGVDIKDESTTIETDVEVSIGFGHVFEVLQGLDEKYKDAVIMRYIDQLSLKEIASITGETVSNVAVRVNRGLKQVKELIENGK